MKKYLLTARNDIVFKALVNNNKEFLKKIIEETLGFKVDQLFFYNTEMPKDIIVEKGKIDCLVLANNKLINIELNSHYYKGLRERNMSYITKLYTNSVETGNTYKDMIEVYQINFSWNLKDEEVRREYRVMDIKDKKEYVKNFCIVEINMDILEKTIYNGNEEYRYTKMLTMSPEEMDRYNGDDDMIQKEVKELVDKMAREKKLFFHDFISPEEDARMINLSYYETGKEEGIEEGKKVGIEENTRKSAKNLYKNGVSKELICKSLNLTNEELEEILEEKE